MADSTTPLDLIAVGSSSKEELANRLFNAASPAMMYGRRASTSTGLTWGYYGGRFNSALIANGTVNLTANQTNYLVAAAADGTVSVAVSDANWNSDDYIRLYLIVVGASTVTSYEDHRQAIWPAGGGGGGGGSGVLFTTLAYRTEIESLEIEPFELDY